LREEICPKCGKLFIPAPEHIFREDGRSWCKWTCWNHRREKPKRVGGKVATSVEMISLSGEKSIIFTSAKEAADCMGFRANGIRDACREKTPYMGYLWEYKD
jgi:hypothetical protein